MTTTVIVPATMSYDGTQHTYTDDSDPTTGLDGGGHVDRFAPAVKDVVSVASYVVNTAITALGGVTTNSTSSTSLLIGTGSKSLTLNETGKAYVVGQFVIIANTANPSNNMVGQVTSFSGTSLVVNVTKTSGSGTLAAWSISVTAIADIASTSSLLKGNGSGGAVAATVRTDYAEPTTALATGLLKNTTSTGVHTIAVAGTDYVKPDTAASITGVLTFDSSTIKVKGSSTGVTTFASNNTGATNYTITFPSENGTVLTTASTLNYAPQTSGTSILKGNGSGGFSSIVSGTDVKTINNNSILGSGDLAITAASIGAMPTSGDSSNTLFRMAQMMFWHNNNGTYTTMVCQYAGSNTGYWFEEGVNGGSTFHAMNSLNGVTSLGRSGATWSNIYLANSPVVSSDLRLKTEVTNELGLSFIKALRPVAYKWIVGGYTTDDPDNPQPIPGTRHHYGFLAQEVKQALNTVGCTDFGGWMLADANDSTSQQSLRLEEFIAPIVKAIQEQQTIIESLEARITALGG